MTKMGSLKPYVLLALMTTPALSNDLIPSNAHKSFTIVVTPSQSGKVDSVTYGFIKNKKKWDGEGMWGYEITVYGIGILPNGDSKKLPEQTYSLTCGIYSEGEDKNDVVPSSAYVSNDIEDAIAPIIEPKLIDVGVGYGFFTPHNYFYDMWWSACTNINQKFTHKTLETLRQMPVTAAQPSLKGMNSNLIPQNFDKAFTVHAYLAMNMSSILSVTYGFIDTIKVFHEEEVSGLTVTVKTVTKKFDGTTTNLPYPNYPHSKQYAVSCEDYTVYAMGESFVDPEAIKANVGPRATDDRSFYYDLWWAVCKKELRVHTNDVLENLRRTP